MFALIAAVALLHLRTFLRQILHGISLLIEKLNFENVKRIVAVLVLISFLFWAWLILNHTNNTGTLEGFYTDHMRQEWLAWLFLQRGFEIFYTPIKYYVNTTWSPYPHPYWPNTPADRPLGCILAWIPAAILSNMFILPDPLVHKLVVVGILLAAHLALYEIALFLIYTRTNPALILLYLLVYYIYVIHWAANGIYDSAVTLFIAEGLVLSYLGVHGRAMLYTSLAMFLHYRALLFYFPALVKQFFDYLKHHTPWRKRLIYILPPVVFVVLDLITYYLTFIYSAQLGLFKSPITPGVQKVFRIENPVFLTSALLIHAFTVPILLLYREWLTLACMAAIDAYFFKMRTQFWHPVLLMLLPLTARTKIGREVTIVWTILILAVLLPNLPFYPKWVFGLIQKALRTW